MATAIFTCLNGNGDSNRGLAWRRSHFAFRAAVAAFAIFTLNRACLSPGAEPELPAPRFMLAWGNEGSEPGEFHFPIGIAITPADQILITDHYNHRVQRFDHEGKLLAHFAVLPNPGGIALDNAGN